MVQYSFSKNSVLNFGSIEAISPGYETDESCGSYTCLKRDFSLQAHIVKGENNQNTDVDLYTVCVKYVHQIYICIYRELLSQDNMNCSLFFSHNVRII